MFAISGTMSWDPSERDAIVKSLIPLCAASRQEEGNVDYWWAEDLSEPGSFHFFEHWASEDTFNSHCQSPGYLAFMEGCMPSMKGVTASRHEISDSRSLV